MTKARIGRGVEHAVARKKDLVMWCVEPTGFGARIRASGAVSFIFQYRPRGGRAAPTRRLTIGKPGAYTVDEARLVARRHAQAVAEGRDPQVEKVRARQTPTVADLFEEWLAHEADRLSPRTIANARSHLRNQLADLAHHRIDDVRRIDVQRVHSAARDAPYAANRAIATLSSAYAYAERAELTAPGSNPAKGVRRHRERPRERMLEADEVARLWAALIRLQGADKHQFSAPAIMLGMLTGWRVGEVRTLAWPRVDLVANEATIVGKTGERRAPLPSSAVPLIHWLAETSRSFGVGDARGKWVFPSLSKAARETAPLADWEHHRTWRMAVDAAGVVDVRRHDLRHLIAGVIGMQTGSALRVKEAMGHSTVAMAERYVARVPSLQRRATDAAADLVLQIAEGREAAAQAVERSVAG